MSLDKKHIISTPPDTHRYPASHWNEINQFVTGDKRDPKDLFYLADDVWDILPYAAHGLPSKPGDFRLRFGRLHSFLKPYVKWYCYQYLLAKNSILSKTIIAFPSVISRADAYLVDHHYKSPDDITSEDNFRMLWNAQLLPSKNDDAAGTRAKVRLQVRTRAFWKHLQGFFEFPQVVPSPAPYEQFRVTESAFDSFQVIPTVVINQFANKLALHREGRETLKWTHMSTH